jgi:hypothetical protein
MKTRRKQLEKKLDDTFSAYIRLRDNYICFTCGANKNYFPDIVMQCGHLITRGRHSLRWSERNACCQCRSCNKKHEHFPEIYTALWINKYCQEDYTDLVVMSWKDYKYTLDDLEDLIEYYTNKIQELKHESGN